MYSVSHLVWNILKIADNYLKMLGLINFLIKTFMCGKLCSSKKGIFYYFLLLLITYVILRNSEKTDIMNSIYYNKYI